jgi:hypothetical protein
LLQFVWVTEGYCRWYWQTRRREVGILLGIETEGTSIGSEVTGKWLAMDHSLDGGSAQILEYASLWFVPLRNWRLCRATRLGPALEISIQRRNP